ncbi:type II secretion system major pseudopilin GspG [Novosphingobium sp.]|uniref:type II secretion system major pseudopilin GspG n=1 Tax=Novosphingobium sp. TaxID=1874826 RepID=UPI001DED9246|nr:type II secretion system major pseudopilin GspG [Novosphingobium sp.]MBX9665295.1 type II secretion system major pseudopilin GspG [Novosphingobium sp.]
MKNRNRLPVRNGFTLLELLVVLAILGLLYAIVGPQVIRYISSSKSETAGVQVKNVDAALKLLRLDTGRYPSAQEGLQALVTQPPGMADWRGPYLPNTAALTDPWGNPYRYTNPGKHGEIDVYSLGSDNAEGGTGEAKDLGNW